jgi:hypothetical protein
MSKVWAVGKAAVAVDMRSLPGSQESDFIDIRIEI